MGVASRARTIRQHHRVYDHHPPPPNRRPGTWLVPFLEFPWQAPSDPARVGFSGFGNWHGVYYVGDTVLAFTDSAYANQYTVYDFRGHQVAAGTFVAGDFTIITIAPTAGGTFPPGWYRVFYDCPIWDEQYGYSCGAVSFCVIRDTAGFQRMPTYALDPTRNGGATPTPDTGGEFHDPVMKGVLGISSSRGQVTRADLVNVSNIYSPALGPGTQADSIYSCQLNGTWTHDWQPSDPVRPWPCMMQFPNGTIDSIVIGNVARFYCKDATLDGSKIFIGSGAGSTPGTSKIQVFSPNATTLVETYDNLTGAAAIDVAINGPSNYIFAVAYNNAVALTQAPTAIQNFFRNGVITAVQQTLPFGVTRFEGPSNEPGIGPDTIYQYNLFQEIVHFADPTGTAKAMGPCLVSNNTDFLTSWDQFFTNNEAYGSPAANPDEISTHMYSSMVGSDINEGRHHYDRWWDLLKKHGMQDKTVWSTESTQGNGVGFLNLWRSVRSPLTQVLLLEQYGVSRANNQYWYDVSHGFWGVPVFLEPENGTLMPTVVLYRVLSEETFGKSHHHAIDFGSVQGNALFLGSVYTDPDDNSSVAVITAICGGGTTGWTVTLNVLGNVPATLTYVDGLGVSSTLNVTGGKVVVPVEDMPNYLRLPTGTLVNVDHCNNWPTTPKPSISQYARGSFSGAQPSTGISDNQLLQFYQHGLGLVQSRATVWSGAPDTAEMFWNSNVSVDSVVVFAGVAAQNWSTITDFDVQTTADSGATWTTRATYTTTDLAGVTHPNAPYDTGNRFESWWDGQYVFDLPLGGTFTVNGLRLLVRGTSYGGVPTLDIAAYGLGYPQHTMQVTLQEIMVPSVSTPSAYTADYPTVIEAEPSLVAFWRMDDANLASGATAASKVNTPALDGVYGAFGTHFAVPGPISDGVAAFATTGDGRDFFDSPSTSTLGLGDTFTVEFWFNSGGSTANSGSGSFLTWFTSASQTANINFSQGGIPGGISLDGVAHTSSGILDGNWHHVAVTKNGAATKIYIDAQDLTVLGTNVTYSGGYASAKLRFSAGTGARLSFANLAVYNTALSTASLQAHYWASALPTAVPAADPLFFDATPQITGTAAVGFQVQSSTGHFSQNPTLYSYQWQSSVNGTSGWTNISAATRSDFIPQEAQFGLFLRSQVTSSNIAGTGSTLASPAVGPVGGTPSGISNVTPPVVTGTAETGLVLSCSEGTWTGSPTVFVYQWQVSATGTGGWTDIPGATSNTFTIPTPDLGLFLRCGVSAS